MSRREVEQHSFSPAATVLVPLGAILLQVLLPRVVPAISIVDLPLLVTLFFAISRRSPIAGTMTGAFIGLLQDAITPNQPIGVNGMAMSLIGYVGASLGSQIDVENVATRTGLTFAFTFAQGMLLYMTQHWLLGRTGYHILWLHELARAAANTVVALPLFAVLDRTKRQEM